MPNPEVERHCQGGGAAALDALEAAIIIGPMMQCVTNDDHQGGEEPHSDPGTFYAWMVGFASCPIITQLNGRAGVIC
jgi:hypothetical protein